LVSSKFSQNKETLVETLWKRTLLYTDGAGPRKGFSRRHSYQTRGGTMFNHYYVQQEKYQDLLKDAEKERLIQQIQKSNQVHSDQNSELKINLIQKLSLIFKDARLVSSEQS
jgi:hypothetical protein